MKASSKTNSAPIAPTSAEPSNAAGSKPRVAMPERGKLMKKKNTAAGDPYKMAKPSRPHVKATSGARYGVRVKFQKSEAPEAGAIQGNGRLLPPAIKRSAQNFTEGMADHT
jgi:hypothetical protein